MARPGRGLIPLALSLLLAASAAGAQGLRTLHVDALSMRTDRARVHVGEVFHLTMHAHVRERIAALDDLVVPDVGTMKLEGDERSVASGSGGTDVTETLTLEPTQPGAFTFKGAYVDAIDARTGKPSRFSSNSVRIVVDAGAAAARRFWPSPMEIIGALALAGTAITVLVGLLLGALLLVRGARGQPTPAPAPLVAAPPPQRTARDLVAEALRAYRAAPAQGSAAALRAALFAAAGAPAGATLRDASAATADHALRAALTAAERFMFGPAAMRGAAASELIDATETWLR